MIFGFFDTTTYNSATCTDIFHPFKSYFDDALSGFVTRKFQITGSPRPEYLSHQLYGSPKYYWVILMANNNWDPFHGWVKSEEAVHQSSMIKYQNLPNKQHTVMYHIDSTGKKYYRMREYPVGSKNWYDEGDVDNKYIQHVGALVPVTAIEHELDLNEAKRVIDIVVPGDLPKFVDALTRIMEKAKNG